MLSRLRVKNFKLLRDVEIVFSSPLTVLIGPNAAGKSTVLEVIEFLRKCADRGLQEAVRRHGGMATIQSIDSSGPIEIESDWEFIGKDHRDEYLLRWSFSINNVHGAASVHSETLRNLALPEDQQQRIDADELGERRVRGSDALWSTPRLKRTELVFETVRDFDKHPDITTLRGVLVDNRMFGSMSVAPSWLRESDAPIASPRDPVVIASEPFMAPDGRGLANALYDLNTEHQDEWDVLVRAVRAEFPFVKRIVFPPDPGGSKISFAVEDSRFGGRKVYSSQLSDGFVALLVLLTATLQPMQQATLLLDEPESHLHPSALRRFVGLCERPPTRRRIIIATHSNALLDFLPDPAAAIRVIEHGPNGAVVRALDKDALDAWRKDYTMSELRAAGQIDKDNTAFEAGP